MLHAFRIILLLTSISVSGQEAKKSPSVPTLVTTERRVAVLDGSYNSFEPTVYTDPKQRHIAQIIKRNGRELVVLDGRQQQAFDSIEPYYEIPAGFGFELRREGGRACERRPIRYGENSLGQGPGAKLKVQFSPDGRRYAYIAKRNTSQFLIIDGEAHGPYAKIRDVVFASSGRLAYSAELTFPQGSDEDGSSLVFVEGLPPLKCLDAFGLEFSPNGRHVAFFTRGHDQSVDVYVDGMLSGKSEFLGGGDLAFSPDSKRLGYLAYHDNQFWVNIDGRELPALTKTLGGSSFGGDEPIVVANGKRFAVTTGDSVIVDGHATKAGLVDRMTFSSDGSRFAYRAWTEEGSRAVIDGKAGPLCDDIDDLQFSPDSRHVVYSAQRHQKGFLVRDGTPGPEVDASIFYSRISPDSRRYAYIEHTGTEDRIMVDGEKPLEVIVDQVDTRQHGSGLHVEAIRQAAELAVAPNDPTLLFSPDSKHIAYVEEFQRDRKQEWSVGVDGARGNRYDARPAGGSLYWVNSTTLRTIAIRDRDILEVTIRINPSKSISTSTSTSNSAVPIPNKQ